MHQLSYGKTILRNITNLKSATQSPFPVTEQHLYSNNAKLAPYANSG